MKIKYFNTIFLKKIKVNAKKFMLNKIATLKPEAKGKLGILILSLIKILIFYSSWVFLH